MDPSKCSHCGSTDIVGGIRVGRSAEAGTVGLSYQSKFLLTGTAPLLADLRKSCGTVHRFWFETEDRDGRLAETRRQ